MNKSVLITGASRGIGAACAEEFAKGGYNIAINYLNHEDAALSLKERLISQYGTDAVCIRADVGEARDCERLIKEAHERFGFIDVLVNNAGVSMQKLVTDTSADEWDRMIGVNLSSVFHCSKAALKYMIPEHKGVIVNIASMWGEVGASMEVAYSASKSGVIGLTKALSKEVAPSNIRVNAVSPGVVMTDMMKDFDEETVAWLKDETPLLTLGAPEDIAKAVCFLASDEARFITGQILSVNGGFVI